MPHAVLRQVAPLTDDPEPTDPLAMLPVRDVVVMTYIVATGISGLRWPVPGADDLAALRRELARREGRVAA